ncbi:phenoloxidase-activating factor 2 [Anabrus simplex]|uniref:phenoloxidase-activating factor 2 n=1 Tax=Anabrus simplex TaxID=316456 RepID=UPI0035A3669E
MLAIFKIHGNYKEIGERIEGKKTFLCAATLVSSHVALTARGCLSSVTNEDIAAGALIVRARVWKLNHEVEYSEHQDRHVQDFREFPDYNSLLKINDVALIFWEEPLNLTTVRIHDEINLSQTTCLAIGWGHYNMDNGTSQQAVLKKVAVPVLDVDTCHMRIQASPYLNMTTILPYHLDRFLCAGGEENRDTCHSDRGGPLICPAGKNSNEYYQVGLLSASIGCGLEGIPALYTKVHNFAYDIKELIEDIENGLKSKKSRTPNL